MRALTPDERKDLYELVANPPPGSKIEAATRLGLDLTVNIRLLCLTPQERIEEAERHRRFWEGLDQAPPGISNDLYELAELEALKELYLATLASRARGSR